MIVDTSVLLDALIVTPFTAKARDVIASVDPLFAPDHLRIEAAGALTRAVRRGDISDEAALRIYARLPALMPHLEPSEPLVDRTFTLSLELTHPFYDCLFLALAERQDSQLITADLRFARKLATTAYAARIIHISEWDGSA